MQSNGLGKSIIYLSLGLLAAYTAEASLITPSTFDFDGQSTANIISHVGSSLTGSGESVISLLRLDHQGSPGLGTGFSVTYGAKGNATISWNLTGMGTELTGIYVYGGGSAHLYEVTLNGELTGSGTIDTPLNQKGKTPGITHILFLGTDIPSPSPHTPTTTVPDAANTCILLGASLLGSLVLR